MRLALLLCLVWSAVAQLELVAPRSSRVFVVHRPRHNGSNQLASSLVDRTALPESPPAGSMGEELQIGQSSVGNQAGQSNSLAGTGQKFFPTSCADSDAESTGFETFTDEGFLKYSDCSDLAQLCHGWENSSLVQQACPVTCFICDPRMGFYQPEGPPCYDAVVTGIRFKNGPEARCIDLRAYCTHSTLFYHVQAACRMTCGLCEAHVGHVEGHCNDANSNEPPEFNINGLLASCSDLVDFCENHPDSYLIRHKCPVTCSACPEVTTSTFRTFQTSQEATFDDGGDPSSCERRRRFGFCATRRRRNT